MCKLSLSLSYTEKLYQQMFQKYTAVLFHQKLSPDWQIKTFANWITVSNVSPTYSLSMKTIFLVGFPSRDAQSLLILNDMSDFAID